MADTIRPPPLPPRPRKVGELLEPIGTARVGELIPQPYPEPDTAPGLGDGAQVLALQRTLRRVRRERDDLRADLDRSTLPPRRTAGQRTVSGLLTGTKWALLLPLVAVAARAAARQWPELTEIVDALLLWLGL